MAKNRFLGKPLVGVILMGTALMFLLVALFVGVSKANTGAGNYANVRNSVALVYSEFTASDGYSYSAIGTAFAIGTPGQPIEYMVTNSHVVEDVQYYGGSLKVYFSAATNDYVVPRIVYQSVQSDRDLVVLKLPEPTNKRDALLMVPSDKVTIGQPVYAIGYPAMSINAESYSAFDTSNATVTQGIISKRTITALGNYEAWQTDTPISGGNSGGPLVDRSGALVGVVVSGFDNADMNYSIVGDELIRILSQNGFPYTLKGSLAPLWISALVIGLVLLTVGLLLFIIGMAAKPAAARSAAAPAAGAVRTPVLRGISGQYAGQRIPLQSRIVIGRDPNQCSLVYPANAPGISSNHCTLSYDIIRGSFLLEDNGSSYGTFLGNGQKLAPHMPVTLQSGDTFYLATTDNRFSVMVEGA